MNNKISSKIMFIENKLVVKEHEIFLRHLTQFKIALSLNIRIY
jgi:hypothetical protein